MREAGIVKQESRGSRLKTGIIVGALSLASLAACESNSGSSSVATTSQSTQNSIATTEHKTVVSQSSEQSSIASTASSQHSGKVIQCSTIPGAQNDWYPVVEAEKLSGPFPWGEANGLSAEIKMELEDGVVGQINCGKDHSQLAFGTQITVSGEPKLKGDQCISGGVISATDPNSGAVIMSQLFGICVLPTK